MANKIGGYNNVFDLNEYRKNKLKDNKKIKSIDISQEKSEKMAEDLYNGKLSPLVTKIDNKK